MRLRTLLAEDEPLVRAGIVDALERAGYETTVARDGAEALKRFAEAPYDVIITDVRMPNVDGLSLFRRVKEESPTTAVILMTAHADVAEAVEVLKHGADDYLTKPFDSRELILRLTRIAERLELTRELREARAVLRTIGPESKLVGRSSVMRMLHERVKTIAPTEATVLILGESGTGKELVARSVHEMSLRSKGPFVAVNCAAFPETLIEAELFGYERGAFTGAAGRRDGRFRTANGGTLFLDEIGEMPLAVQAKLLRVLQEGQVEPLGSDKPVDVDVRLLCATHRNLKELMNAGGFREDLYYRLNVIQLPIAPLRERRADLPLLVGLFYTRFSGSDDSPQISPQAWAALAAYSFPGNVRELEHAMHHAVILARGREIDVQHLPTDIAGLGAFAEEASAGAPTLAKSMKEFERQCLLRALNETNGKKARAAELLGISRKTLWEKLKSHEISISDLEGA
ncbi:MAG: sigma-54-dependent Fis family transcriptional regulator [Deltaproteobacteria bacterium]|nr:MAG: sigma-54-dependent Fis family transcriptional regulator [Deltaproteobacteria bacterium]